MNEENTTQENFDIKNVQKNINELNEIQKKILKIHKILLLILKKYSQTIDENNFTKKYSLEISNMLSTVLKNIDTSSETISLLRKLLTKSKNIVTSSKKQSLDDLELKEYLLLDKKYFTLIVKNYKMLEEFTISNYDLLKTETKISEEIKQIDNKKSQISSSFIENTLTISETQNKVFLPYTIEKIEEYISNNPKKKLSIQEVIDSVYTVSLDTYKNSVLSRFSEAFKLIRNKEHGSIKDALDLAFEVAFNYTLHPAIITACDSLNELDIYLACLEYDELEDFRFFDINFEVAPVIPKKLKN